MPVSSKEFLSIQATIECGFTLKHVRGMIRTYSNESDYSEDYSEENASDNEEICSTIF